MRSVKVMAKESLRGNSTTTSQGNLRREPIKVAKAKVAKVSHSQHVLKVHVTTVESMATRKPSVGASNRLATAITIAAKAMDAKEEIGRKAKAKVKARVRDHLRTKANPMLK